MPSVSSAWSTTEKALAVTSTLSLVGLPILTTAAWATWQDSPKAVVDEAWQIVNEDYVDPGFNQVDWLEERQTLYWGRSTPHRKRLTKP
jgi:hypothetical protein